jgi:hypothetical protein
LTGGLVCIGYTVAQHSHLHSQMRSQLCKKLRRAVQEAAQPAAQPDHPSAASLRALCCVSILQAFRFIFGYGIFLKRFSHRAVP